MTPYATLPDVTVWNGDATRVLEQLADRSIDGVVTSPPYLDARPEYPGHVEWSPLLEQLARVVTGAVLVNVGRRWRDRVELLWWLTIVDAAREHELELLDSLVWIKPNANPIRGRVVTDAHELVLVLGRRDLDVDVTDARTPYAPETLSRFRRRFRNGTGVKGSIRERENRTAHELGARPRSWFPATTGREKGNPHPAPMPLEVALRLVPLAAPRGGTVLDPFAGSGTTAVAARELGRSSILVDLDATYCELAATRLGTLTLDLELSSRKENP